MCGLDHWDQMLYHIVGPSGWMLTYNCDFDSESDVDDSASESDSEPWSEVIEAQYGTVGVDG